MLHDHEAPLTFLSFMTGPGVSRGIIFADLGPRGAAMELHTRDAKDEVALAQLGAARCPFAAYWRGRPGPVQTT